MHRFSVFAVVGAVAAFSGCGADEQGDPAGPRATVAEAAKKVLEAGPSAAQLSAITPGGDYMVRGSLDPDPGYRFCGVIERAPETAMRGLHVWIGRSRGQYETLIQYRHLPASTRSDKCVDEWLNDHPPTLPLRSSEQFSPGGPYNGVEDYVHAILAAVTRFDAQALSVKESRRCALGNCYLVKLDFARLERERKRDEDLDTLRPLLRSLGRHPLEIRVDPDGWLDRLRLAAPSPSDHDTTPSAIAVTLRLSEFGEAEEIEPAPEVTAIE